MKQDLESMKNLNAIISPGCDGSFSPSAAKNFQNSVRDVAMLFRIQIIATFEAIQQAH